MTAPGSVTTGADPVAINADRETIALEVTNTGDRPIQVGSHCHFFEANRGLVFDRATAFGYRLDIPAGTAVRFEPGTTQTVELVAIGGDRRAVGINGLTEGDLDDPAVRERALDRAREGGFES